MIINGPRLKTESLLRFNGLVFEDLTETLICFSNSSCTRKCYTSRNDLMDLMAICITWTTTWTILDSDQRQAVHRLPSKVHLSSSKRLNPTIAVPSHVKLIP